MTSLHAASATPIPPCPPEKELVYFPVCSVRPHAEANQNLMRCVGRAGGIATVAKRAAEGTLTDFARQGMQRPGMFAYEP